MALNKIKTSSLDDDSVTSAKLANGAVTANDINDGELPLAKISQVNLDIAPEVLEIQVSAPAAGQATTWLWTWLTSSLPYARREITNSPEIQVPLYRQGTYTVNNYAAYDLFDQMTQTHSLYLKWIDGAGTDNLVSWATSTGPVSDSHPDINSGNATDVQRINISVPATITLPTLTPPTVNYTVVNNGAGAYTFSGSASGDNPNIGPFYRGGTYTFNITATGHPLYLTTDNGTNFASGTYFGEYTDGVTGSRTDSGTLTIVVPNDAPDTLYYQCGNHGVMRGAITVKDLAVETNINGNPVVYFQHTQEGHKTPVELRPIPALVNQMCLVYDAGTGKFVPQDLATYVENTPSFENKIREVAGTAELVVEDGSAVIAKVNVYDDSTYLPLTGNNPGDQAFATDTDILYIWDGSAWQQAGAANTDDLSEGSTNLFYTDARVGTYLSSNGYDTATNIVASITDSAPTTLDTLNELAAALGDDPNFATTVTNSIADKLPLAGGTLTGGLAGTTASFATITSTSSIQLGDSVKAQFGASNDLQIYHDSTASYIREQGTGSLFIQGSNIWLENPSGQNFILCNDTTGEVSLYNNGATKFQTRPSGVFIGDISVAPDSNSTLHVHKNANDGGDGDGQVNFGDESSIIISTNATVAGPQGYLGSMWFGSQDVTTNTEYNWKVAGIASSTGADTGAGTSTGNLEFYTTNNSSTPTLNMILDKDGNLILNGDSLVLPTSTTDPSGFQAGQIYYNTTAKTIKIYNGSTWSEVYEPPFTATGGTITTSGQYTIHTFTSSGTFSVTSGSREIEYLVIAGGGGGDGTSIDAGGGGAGGYRCSVSGESSGGNSSAESPLTMSSGNYSITVGAGGNGGTGDNSTSGANSSISGPGITTITSIGGGAGRASSASGLSGGSSGGSGGDGGSDFHPTASGTAGQGTDGGEGMDDGAGGGGAGQAGEDSASGGSSNQKAGKGGDGLSSSITGSAVTRAGGGGGGGEGPDYGGAGGGGRGGGASPGWSAIAGTTNTGSGGGGGEQSIPGANGGSGIVILRYLT